MKRLQSLALSSCTLLAACGASAILTGCTSSRRALVDLDSPTTGPATTQSSAAATSADPSDADFSRWLDQPGVGAVEYDDFDALVRDCEQVVRDYLFKLARVDYRDGVVTSEPLVSAQAFEFWRPDLSTSSVTDATVATHRRTIVFKVVKEPNGKFAAVPKVVIERQAVAERRVTSVVLYRDTLGVRNERKHDAPHGSRELDQGVVLPRRYWYAVGRDASLEKRLALSLSSRLVKESQ